MKSPNCPNCAFIRAASVQLSHTSFLLEVIMETAIRYNHIQLNLVIESSFCGAIYICDHMEQPVTGLSKNRVSSGWRNPKEYFCIQNFSVKTKYAAFFSCCVMHNQTIESIASTIYGEECQEKKAEESRIWNCGVWMDCRALSCGSLKKTF